MRYFLLVLAMLNAVLAFANIATGEGSDGRQFLTIALLFCILAEVTE